MSEEKEAIGDDLTWPGFEKVEERNLFNLMESDDKGGYHTL